MYSVETIFKTGLQYHHYANTAYPLTPASFRQYKERNKAKYPAILQNEWDKTQQLSLYVHIPFCAVRCKFCEYVVLDNSGKPYEDEYTELLLKEIELYKKILKNKLLVGYDLGGGTPSKLSIENLKRITQAVANTFEFAPDVEFSVETTPAIAAREPEKIKALYEMGYRRISMGIQTVSEKLLNELGREGTTHIYKKAVENIRLAGFEKFNIDLMYGFLHQEDREFENTILYATTLAPEYITLYRNRYKGTKLENQAGGVSLYKAIRQYRLAYNLLNKKGYNANFGKNTFSKLPNDYGTSDYLTKRVIEGMPYLGLGLGAQSFGIDYLAYNQGAASKKLNRYKEMLLNNEYPIQDLYPLPKEESIAKMVSVAFYFGFIDLEAFKKRFKIDFIEYFKEEVDFLLNEELMKLTENRLYLTRRGSDYINGIIPLFYSQASKKELLELYEKSEEKYDQGEKTFLEAYSIEKFQRPSVAIDIVNFVENKNKNLSLVLIKRAEHPFMNQWALPGGFVRPQETVEQAAIRELTEETGIKKYKLKQLKTFSRTGRDPRGWIISVAFWQTLKSSDIQKLTYSDDAIDVKLFHIKITTNEQSAKDIKLINENEQLLIKYTTLNNGELQLLHSEGIAFDHSEIIASALEKYLNSNKENK